MSWNILEKTYRTHGLVLVLGAGVSVECNLPTWPDLLERIGRICMGDNAGSVISALRKSGYNLPFIAGLLKMYCPEGMKFVEIIRDQLYRDFPYYRQDLGKGNRTGFFRYILSNNSTLAAVGSMCAQKVSGTRRFRANPLIHAVVNFNMDSLLQAYIVARFTKRLVLTIERPSAGLSILKQINYERRINVYHMHGFLRFDSKKGDPKRESTDLVFTEQDYFDFFNNPNSLFNYTFLSLLREHPCLFLGLSMTDENIRRLLHYSKQEREESLKREGRAGAIPLETIRHFAVFKRFISEDINRITEKTLLNLGIRVLWVDHYAEIPDHLGNIYRANGDDWNSVF